VFCAQHLEDTFKRVVAASAVAAIIAEPILGEGGFVTPPREFFSILQDICKKHGILFIADEVQTGFGRTGRLFACERYGIEPDLFVAAKSLGGGMPLAAVTGRAEIMDSPGVGGLGGTFGGNPLSCAAALAVLESMEKENLSARAELLGEKFTARAMGWQRRCPIIGEVRGLGAMQALELVTSQETREPAKHETEQIMRYCYEHGLLAISAGTYGNVIRLLVPLVISDADFDEGLDVLEGALAAVSETHASAETRHA
jgi:4-aminobutyrate aminotransferase/(S)-3-amino-2-methylpropionate transaminase